MMNKVEYNRLYNSTNRDKISVRKREYYLKNKERIKQKDKLRYELNSDKIKAYSKKFRKNNPTYITEYRKRRSVVDPKFKLLLRLRGLTAQAFTKKKWLKDKGSSSLLGCSLEVAKQHIEFQFTEGMSWANHGEWEIDHKVPLSFATSKEHLYSLCHYSNLQPLWKHANRVKSNKVIPIQDITIITLLCA